VFPKIPALFVFTPLEMSATNTQHRQPPKAIRKLAEQLDLDPAIFIDESLVGRRGFFRHGRKTADACRYCLENDRIIGLSLRGQNVSNLSWMADEAFNEIEDLLFGENSFTSLTIPGSWTKLRRVDLSHSPRLRRVVFAGSADALERLEITDAGLTQLQLPAAGCPKLQYLDLSRSEIKKLVLSGPCSSIHSLHLRAAALETLSLTADFPVLDTLDVAENPSSKLELPAHLILPQKLLRLYAKGCAPKNCPTVLLQGADNAIDQARSWFQALQAGSEKNRIVKLLINGNGNVGKSTLWCALKNLKESACTCDDHQTTHGIELTVEALSLEDVDFRGWDFGGQEVYQGTHRLFLTDGAVQVMVLDYVSEEAARTGDPVPDRSNGTAEEPAKLVRNLALQHFYKRQKALGPSSKFIIVQTKKSDGHDRHPAALQLEREENLPYEFLDAKKTKGVRGLREDLQDVARELPIHGMQFPNSWLKVRQWLASNLRANKTAQEPLRVITKTDFHTKVVKDFAVIDDERMIDALLTFLHAAGDVYVNKEHLKDRIIIDLNWALEGIYRPLQRGGFQRRAKQDKGKLFVDDIYPDTTGAERDLLLEFMQSCGMCFPADWQTERNKRNDYYIFPAFLPAEADPIVTHSWKKLPSTPSWSATLPFRDLPAIQALICDLGRKTTKVQLWAEGIDLLLSDTRERKEQQVHLPMARCKIELAGGSDAAALQCQLVVTLDDPEAAAWLPSIQEWINEHFQNLNWTSNDTAQTQVQAEVLRSGEQDLFARKDLRERVSDETRVAFCISNHPNFSQVDYKGEREEISNQLEGYNVHLAAENALTEDKLAAAIDNGKDYVRVLHFVGHGEKKGIFLYDNEHLRNPQKLGATELKNILWLAKKTNPALECVVLNACLSSSLARAASEVGCYAVGTTDEVENREGTYFSAGFYKSLNRDPGNYEAAFTHGITFCERKLKKPAAHLFNFFTPQIS
jgi:GTPase SAR1 family protein